MSEDQLKKWFEDLFHKNAMANPIPLENVTKQIEQFNKQTQDSWEQFSKLLQTTFMDVGEKVIETNIQGGPGYRTTVFLMEIGKMNFRTPAPVLSDVYWVRDNQLVDETLALQKEIITKVIDTIGSTIQKVVNPISFSTGDIVSLANLFKKP